MEKQDLLYKGLKKYFGFDTFKGNQEAIIRSILSEKDSFVLMLPVVGSRFAINFPR